MIFDLKNILKKPLQTDPRSSIDKSILEVRDSTLDRISRVARSGASSRPHMLMPVGGIHDNDSFVTSIVTGLIQWNAQQNTRLFKAITEVDDRHTKFSFEFVKHYEKFKKETETALKTRSEFDRRADAFMHQHEKFRQQTLEKYENISHAFKLIGIDLSKVNKYESYDEAIASSRRKVNIKLTEKRKAPRLAFQKDDGTADDGTKSMANTIGTGTIAAGVAAGIVAAKTITGAVRGAVAATRIVGGAAVTGASKVIKSSGEWAAKSAEAAKAAPEAISKLAPYAKYGGKALGVVGAGIAGYDFYKGYKDGGVVAGVGKAAGLYETQEERDAAKARGEEPEQRPTINFRKRPDLEPIKKEPVKVETKDKVESKKTVVERKTVFDNKYLSFNVDVEDSVNLTAARKIKLKADEIILESDKLTINVKTQVLTSNVNTSNATPKQAPLPKLDPVAPGLSKPLESGDAINQSPTIRAYEQGGYSGTAPNVGAGSAPYSAGAYGGPSRGADGGRSGPDFSAVDSQGNLAPSIQPNIEMNARPEGAGGIRGMMGTPSGVSPVKPQAGMSGSQPAFDLPDSGNDRIRGNEGLANMRSKFKEELTPEMREIIAAVAISEVGSSDRKGWEPGTNDRDLRGEVETMFNRADAHGRTIGDVVGKDKGSWGRKYYAPYMAQSGFSYYKNLERIRNDPKLKAKLDRVIDDVMAGSNDSNFGTHNASAGVARNARGNQTVTAHAAVGEQFSRKDVRPDVHGAGVVKNESGWYKRALDAYSSTVNNQSDPGNLPQSSTGPNAGSADFWNSTKSKDLGPMSEGALAQLHEENKTRAIHRTGIIQIGDEQFEFGSGDRRGVYPSIPHGVYPITSEYWSQSMQKPAFGLNNEDHTMGFDPLVGRKRTGIVIHTASTNDIERIYTKGCIGIPPNKWEGFRKALYKFKEKYGAAYLEVGKDGTPLRITSKPPTKEKPKTVDEAADIIQRPQRGEESKPLKSDEFQGDKVKPDTPMSNLLDMKPRLSEAGKEMIESAIRNEGAKRVESKSAVSGSDDLKPKNDSLPTVQDPTPKNNSVAAQEGPKAQSRIEDSSLRIERPIHDPEKEDASPGSDGYGRGSESNSDAIT